MIKGLATVIYAASDLARTKAWYAAAFQQPPYFDQPYYVGFNISGFELGLDPHASHQGAGGCVAYWRVENLDAAVAHFAQTGATVVSPIQDVGEGIKVATLADPFGNHLGLIENPGFKLP
jgi:predicted enzyme related to lactoylglutathione lyase